MNDSCVVETLSSVASERLIKIVVVVAILVCKDSIIRLVEAFSDTGEGGLIVKPALSLSSLYKLTSAILAAVIPL